MSIICAVTTVQIRSVPATGCEPALTQAVFLSLKEHIANILNMEQILAYIETLPFHQAEVQKMDSQLVRKQEELARYGRLKASLYESLSDGLMDKTEYLELKASYDRKIADAQASEKKLKVELENLLQNRGENSVWIQRFKLHQNLAELTRRIAVTLIDRIYVYKDSRIDIRFKYQYDYDRALELIQNIQRLQPANPVLPVKEAV